MRRHYIIIASSLALAGCGRGTTGLTASPSPNAKAPTADAGTQPESDAAASTSATDAASPTLDAGALAADANGPPPDTSCGACAACGDYAQDCAEACVAMRAALEPTPAAAWWACVREDVCQPERAWTCLHDTRCEDPALVGAHCDALARCSMDGRGWLDEAACRADPYHEPEQWACLPPDRRQAIKGCLDTMQCGQLEMCLTNAACAGDPGCMRVMSTRLVVDCHQICFNDSNTCGGGGDRFPRCMSQCNEAAFRLADRPRRELEACALAADQCAPGSTTISDCAAQLRCDVARPSAAVAIAESRCGAQPALSAEAHRWACLGEVIQAGIEQCAAESPCGQLADCVGRATCGDSEGCLAFLAELDPL